MRKALFGWAKSKKGVITIAMSLSFVLGTLGLTLVQASSFTSSVQIQIYPEQGTPNPDLVVKLFIHHYQVLPNHVMFHATLKFINNYDNDIMVHNISIQSWSCSLSYDPDEPCSDGETQFLYGEAERTGVYVPAGETTKMQLNQKAYHVNELIADQDVYNYYSISWTHETETYFKGGHHIEDATSWWGQLELPNP